MKLNKQKVASELVKIAKELQGGNRKYKKVKGKMYFEELYDLAEELGYWYDGSTRPSDDELRDWLEITNEQYESVEEIENGYILKM